MLSFKNTKVEAENLGEIYGQK